MSRLHFIINPTSGGGHGARLAQALTALLGAGQVAILGRCDLVAEVAALGPDDAVIACGGDGTASAVAEVIAARPGRGPAMGVVPLGTGNDLARVLGWSHWRQGDLPGLVGALRVAGRRQFDRWRLDGPGCRRSWCNYLSIGIDAAVAYHFHHLRLRHPGIARGGNINRGIYGLLGAQQRAVDLHRLVRLSAGLALPRWASGLVLCNIPSYAGGVTLARGMRTNDGQLEALIMGHGLSLGLVTARLRRPRLLGRFAHLSFAVGEGVVMQTDGEPFAAQPGHYRLSPASAITVLVADGAPCAT